METFGARIIAGIRNVANSSKRRAGRAIFPGTGDFNLKICGRKFSMELELEENKSILLWGSDPEILRHKYV